MIFLPRKIIQQPPLGLVAGSQSADPAAAFDDGQPGLVRAAEYSRLALGLPRHGTCERMPQFCAAAQPS